MSVLTTFTGMCKVLVYINNVSKKNNDYQIKGVILHRPIQRINFRCKRAKVNNDKGTKSLSRSPVNSM